MYYIVLALCNALRAPYIFQMALPKKEKSEPRPVSVSFRISQRAASNLKTLAKEHNRAVIVVTHETEFAQSSERIVTLVDGKLV